MTCDMDALASTAEIPRDNAINGGIFKPLISQEDLEVLFTLPLTRRPRLSPLCIRGSNPPEAAETVRRLLKDNHERWHVLFSDLGFHNHTAHHILAVFALGAPKPLIEAVYPIHTWYQRPLAPSPKSITEDDFLDHLGDPKFYHSYVNFFRAQVLEHGMDVKSLLEKFIFSERFNIRDAKTGSSTPHPHMLARLLASVFHPFIHVGNACEFGISGLLTEGLAEACIHPADIESILDGKFLGFGNDDENAHSDSDQGSVKGIHLLTVLAAINEDETFSLNLEGLDGIQKFHLAMEKCADKFKTYVNQWIGVQELHRVDDGGATEEFEDVLEQITWVISLLYGVSGWRGAERGFVNDFFCMHNLTASLFLHSVIPHLGRKSQLVLLRTFLLQALCWWASRGRHPINIPAFYRGEGSTQPVGAYPSLGSGGAVGTHEVEEIRPIEVIPEQVLADEHAKEGRMELAVAAGDLPAFYEFANVGVRIAAQGMTSSISASTSSSTSNDDGEYRRYNDGDYSPDAEPSTPLTSASASVVSLSLESDVQAKKDTDGSPYAPVRPPPINAWTQIIRSALVHPEEHVVKTVRALSHFSQLWGVRRSAGDRWFWGGCRVGCVGDESHSHLPGLEVLDGTLFVRTAGMTMDRMGWMREGERLGTWSGRQRNALATATAQEHQRRVALEKTDEC